MADRREQKESLRAQRLERERAEAAARRRWRLVLVVLAAIVAIAVAGGAAAFTLTGGADSPEAGGVDAARVPPRRQRRTSSGRWRRRAARCAASAPAATVSTLRGACRTESKPPRSGPHNPIPAEDGAYQEAPPMENLVHSLEHGRITVQYGPDVPDEVVGDLKAMFDEDPVHMILVPDQSGMEYAVAATAWVDEVGEPQPLRRLWATPRSTRRPTTRSSLPRLLPRPRPRVRPLSVRARR